jgi:hypothetical protein
MKKSVGCSVSLVAEKTRREKKSLFYTSMQEEETPREGCKNQREKEYNAQSKQLEGS